MKERSGVDKHGLFNDEEKKRIIGCAWKARPPLHPSPFTLHPSPLYVESMIKKHGLAEKA
jgi:hypothetical protein